MNSALRMVVLVENRSERKELVAEHGLAIWMAYQDKQLLFDTGQTTGLLANASHLGIDLNRLDAVVLSHGHYDHTGGLDGVLQMARKARVFLHPKAMKIRYSFKNGGKARSIGMPAEGLSALRENKECVVFLNTPQMLFPGVWMTGPVKRQTEFESGEPDYCMDTEGKHFDLFEDDQALVCESAVGLVVVLGCAHSGVVNTLLQVKEQFPDKPIHTVVGGMHLQHAGAGRIENTLKALQAMNVHQIFPGHCTGPEMERVLSERYQEKCRTLFSGMEIIL
ncbi:MBL fold metallo-hydrolase [bacterium]|nr:MBL fold metallo-hydrolase [bacterium]